MALQRLALSKPLNLVLKKAAIQRVKELVHFTKVLRNATALRRP